MVPGRPSRHGRGDRQPGSRVRKLYDRREKALQQLAVARRNLDEAKARLARRHRVMLLLTEG
ncbi:hypothetical protein ACFSZS_20585 [Seohaeicola zhoushanensis]